MFYKALLRPLLFQVPPETVHHWGLKFLSQQSLTRPLSAFFKGSYPTLKKTVWGLDFPNPVGLAAGFDKNGLALRGWESLGFGFIELGTVTHEPQIGNPRPRLFRLSRDHALINRLGFPNQGADAVRARLEKTRNDGLWPSIPVGINIGKSKVVPLEEAAADYLATFKKLREFGDYFVVNVSSPNTPGLRTLQSRDQLSALLGPLQDENHRGGAPSKPRPLLVKISPDLREEEIDPIIETMLQFKCDGIVATNTTINKNAVALKEEGGLSGEPLRRRSTAMIRLLAQKTAGKLPIIGAGGIFDVRDAQDKFLAGATLIQAYTGLVYEGPRFVRNICDRL